MMHPKLNFRNYRDNLNSGIVEAITRPWITGCLAILLALSVIVASVGECAEVTLQTASQVAAQKLRHHIALHGSWNGTMTPTIQSAQAIEQDGSVVAYNFSIQPSGHILVAVDDELSPVLLYSTSSPFNIERVGQPNSIESWIVPEINKNMKFIIQRRINPNGNTRSALLSDSEDRIAMAWKRFTNSDSGDDSDEFASSRDSDIELFDSTFTRAVEVGPLLETAWGQDEPYNIMTPDDGCASGHTLTGCVATAWAQLMRYWRWPIQGTGSYSYTWNEQTLSADFNVAYDWDNMLSTIDTNSRQTEQEAVGQLIYHAGIAAEMDFGCTSSESMAWADEVLDVYFGYKSTMQFKDRSQFTASDWFALFKSELDSDPPRPVIFTIFDVGSAGHEVVVDGYQDDATDMVHINFGWEGYEDGYYNITSNFSAGGYTWLANAQYIVTGIEPVNDPPVVYLEAVNQTVEEGVQVQLTGSADDPEGVGIKSYLWTQTSGPTVTLAGSDTSSASFTSPDVNAETKLVFQLRADDINLAYKTISCTITVNNTDGSEATTEISSSTRSSGGGGGGGGCFITSALD